MKLILNIISDLPSFLSPCLRAVISYRPDLLLSDVKMLYILELTVGCEANIQNNSDRKAANYSSLINDLSPYSKIVFLNFSMSAVGVMGSSCNSM